MALVGSAGQMASGQLGKPFLGLGVWVGFCETTAPMHSALLLCSKALTEP